MLSRMLRFIGYSFCFVAVLMGLNWMMSLDSNNNKYELVSIVYFVSGGLFILGWGVLVTLARIVDELDYVKAQRRAMLNPHATTKKFKVTGTDKATGKETSIVTDAVNKTIAIKLAMDMGLIGPLAAEEILSKGIMA